MARQNIRRELRAVYLIDFNIAKLLQSTSHVIGAPRIFRSAGEMSHDTQRGSSTPSRSGKAIHTASTGMSSGRSSDDYDFVYMERSDSKSKCQVQQYQQQKPQQQQEEYNSMIIQTASQYKVSMIVLYLCHEYGMQKEQTQKNNCNMYWKLRGGLTKYILTKS